MGGNNQNQAIHIERNRIFGNGSSECNGGITIAGGNPDTLIVNNLIYGNGRNGITFIDADGGPHSLIQNTIFANAWSGINVARSHEVFLVSNVITGNGTASGSTGGRFGVSREGSTSPQPQGIHLLYNLVCGNRLGEINGPALDPTDANNLTPTGAEGSGVLTSPGCELPATVYANLNGPDGLPNTADDDVTLAAASPAIDRGMDPRTLGINPLFNPLFEADNVSITIRPNDGDGNGAAAFDLGAQEYLPTIQLMVTGLSPAAAVHGQTVSLTIIGTDLAVATGVSFLRDGQTDAELTATNLRWNVEGTALQATVAIAPTATLGVRVVTVTTPGGTSGGAPTSGNTFTVLGQLSLVPDLVSLVAGQSGNLTVQLSAPAPAGDLLVTLESANPSVATVPASLTVPAGASTAPTPVTAIAEGTATLTASAPGFAPGTSAFSVQARGSLSGLTPSALSLPKGTTGTLTVAIGPAQPEATVVPLSVSNPAVVGVPAAVTIPANALTASLPITTLTQGSATITAGPLNGTSQTATVTVTPPILASLAISPATPIVISGQSLQLTAVGTLTDSTTQDLTPQVTWASGDLLAVNISTSGLATALTPGTTTITATHAAGLTASASVTVLLPPASLAALEPQSLAIPPGSTGTLTATLSAGQPVDTTISLQSSDPTVATVPPSVTVPPGQLTVAVPVAAGAPGTATITASLNASHLESTVVVSPEGPTLTSLVPTTLYVAPGASGTFTLTLSTA